MKPATLSTLAELAPGLVDVILWRDVVPLASHVKCGQIAISSDAVHNRKHRMDGGFQIPSQRFFGTLAGVFLYAAKSHFNGLKELLSDFLISHPLLLIFSQLYLGLVTI